MFGDTTLNFAHRGFTVSAPENSLAAFEAAVELGVDGIELDTRVCKSGELIVFHDPTLKRMTDGRGFIKTKTLTELRDLRLKSAEGSSGERIPSLSEVLDYCKGKALLNIEIKTNGLPKDHIEARLVKMVKDHRVEEQTIISSFNPVIIRRIKKIDPDLLTGYLIDKKFTVRKFEVPLTKLSGARAVHLEQSLVKEKLIARMKRLGYFCVVWSVNDPQTMRRFVAMGVHAIISDKPAVLKTILRS